MHSTSEYVGFFKRNPTPRRTRAAQLMILSLAYAMRIQPPVSTQSNHRPRRCPTATAVGVNARWWSSPPDTVPARYSVVPYSPRIFAMLVTSPRDPSPPGSGMAAAADGGARFLRATFFSRFFARHSHQGFVLR
jgi:hypothetical protein